MSSSQDFTNKHLFLIHPKIGEFGQFSRNFKIASEFESLNPHGTLGEFISHLSLMGEFDIELEEGYEFDDAVRVTTIHQSKGKEYAVVFIADVATDRHH